MISDVQKAWEACDRIDTLFVLVCTVFCWPIIPAVGLGYSGYSTRRSGLASFIPAVLTICVVLDSVVHHWIYACLWGRSWRCYRQLGLCFSSRRALGAGGKHSCGAVLGVPTGLRSHGLCYSSRWCLRARPDLTIDTIHLRTYERRLILLC